eukprot:4589729-Lingulodinium_polyedra.AAC.1
MAPCGRLRPPQSPADLRPATCLLRPNVRAPAPGRQSGRRCPPPAVRSVGPAPWPAGIPARPWPRR